MIDRPSDLPDFADPPVTEVVLGVQFDGIERLLSAHLGLMWELFRSEFPEVEEHTPLIPTFETFGPNPPGGLGRPFAMRSIVGMPRSFFINRNRTQLLQVQKDRFLHNWRKVGDQDTYPRFETMLETFGSGIRQFGEFIEVNDLGAVIPNQCELSYVNHIPIGDAESGFKALARVFGGLVPSAVHPELNGPEDAGLFLRYLIRDETGAPTGRLIVNGEPARTADGRNIVQLTLTARGAPRARDLAAVSEFLNVGRRHIVRGFAELTSPAMHELWGRKQ